MGEVEFKVGDIVELKSGGPPMTVVEVNTNLAGECEVKCKWWYGKIETESFSPDLLKPGKGKTFEELRPFSVPSPDPLKPPEPPEAPKPS
jgi:uncharacterized protein YodC (DUF2158 family)